jgi:mannitol-specific phosphotransferase system IIBC component
MLHILLGLCVGLLPSLIATFVIIRKVNGKSELLRERLAAEEASKRHFMQQASQLELTVERMHQEQKRLEVELARGEGVQEQIAA